jgi:hypothetical protein
MLLRKFHDIESKAFSKSINNNKPGISFSSAYSIISNKSLIFSPMYLPAIKQVWSLLINVGRTVMVRTRKYYLKNNYLTLSSKVKVPRRSLWYATHRLMVMHPHTKYHSPILKDKNVMARTRKYYLKNNYLTLRSTVKVPQGHYGMWHTALWSCTHIPNIIDLSQKIKMLWPGQENTI